MESSRPRQSGKAEPRHAHLPSTANCRGKSLGYTLLLFPYKAAQGPQMNLPLPLLFTLHSLTAPIHTALSPMGREHSPLQPCPTPVPRLSPPHKSPPGCLPASSISPVSSRIDSTQKTCSCRSGTTNRWQPDGLRAQKILKLSTKAAGKSP